MKESFGYFMRLEDPMKLKGKLYKNVMKLTLLYGSEY